MLSCIYWNKRRSHNTWLIFQNHNLEHSLMNDNRKIPKRHHTVFKRELFFLDKSINRPEKRKEAYIKMTLKYFINPSLLYYWSVGSWVSLIKLECVTSKRVQKKECHKKVIDFNACSIRYCRKFLTITFTMFSFE